MSSIFEDAGETILNLAFWDVSSVSGGNEPNDLTTEQIYCHADGDDTSVESFATQSKTFNCIGATAP